jgi:hypothetical protein
VSAATAYVGTRAAAVFAAAGAPAVNVVAAAAVAYLGASAAYVGAAGAGVQNFYSVRHRGS